jgi:hypothetical protein
MYVCGISYFQIVVFAGAFLTNEPLEDFSSCKHICGGNQRTFSSATVGIRCCYDVDNEL